MLDTFVSIGDTLKEIRETKGFQLQEVAKETAINYTILSRIETGMFQMILIILILF